MAKTKEVEFMCESHQSYISYEKRIKVIADVSNEDLANLINSISKEDYFNFLDNAVFEEWATDNGYKKEAIAE